MEVKRMTPKKGAGIVLLIGAVLIVMVLYAGRAAGPFGHTNIDTPRDCGEFLAELGWDANTDAADVQTTVLPKVFDDVFTQYNGLQNMQGCDLTPYAGKAITVYNLPVTNYESCDGDVFATVLVYKGKVIGGDIHSPALGGFMHGLR